MEKEKLEKFVRLLRRPHRVPMLPSFDLGLVTKESKSRVKVDAIFNGINQIAPSEKVVYDKSVSDEDVIEKVIEVFKKRKWVFLEIKRDISSSLLNQLKHLANHNALQLLDYQGKDLSEIKMPKETRIIVFAERNLIENEITYPHFYRIFGPTLSIK